MADKSRKVSKEKAGEPPPSSGQDINEIREILFGADLRNHDQRFAAVETTINETASLLEKKFDDQIQQMQEHFTKEIGKLSGFFQNLDTQSSSAREALQDSLSLQIKALEKSIQAELKSLQKTQAIDTDRLADQKTDRAVLAELLSEMAERLKDAENEAGRDASAD